MILGIMQPYFFPYIGYFDLINRTDRWIVFDVVKYHPKSWMNRNRVLHPTGGWQYVSVPVDKHAGDGLIKDARILNTEMAKARILGQLTHYRAGRAPHYQAVVTLVERAFEAAETDRLRDLNVASLAVTCEYLGISFKPENLSEMPLDLSGVHHAGGWAVEIARALGASEYINPPGGREIFNEREFELAGIRLRFTEAADFRYPTGRYEFQERMSILDVLMWNDSASVREYLENLATSVRLKHL